MLSKVQYRDNSHKIHSEWHVSQGTASNSVHAIHLRLESDVNFEELMISSLRCHHLCFI